MPTEKVNVEHEVLPESQYTQKSFELVFANFCNQYADSLGSLGSSNNGRVGSFFGVGQNAPFTQVRARYHELARAMGHSPAMVSEHHQESYDRDDLLFSARYLAWHATLGAVTQQYIDIVRHQIDKEGHRKTSNGGSHINLGRLHHDREKATTVLVAQNHALRGYFDSPAASAMGNDSPAQIGRLLETVPNLSNENKGALVEGISLEIAAKRHLQAHVSGQESEEVVVAFGSNNQDSRGGDIVILRDGEILFIDVKSSMPKVFSDGKTSTPEDYQRGYRWLDSPDAENKVVVWGYLTQAVENDAFRLADRRLADNLELVANSKA